ncbi:hypothetical protein [Klebsiella pneumoniae]|uniref:hypothetical protein n=1 Tax=Klebsiella pneumoniae TaxID=573 RepID=UPI002556316F|nr:hypothetical protein [Klebsiella pneumoniae]MDK8122585.1 hypothetical protein [Klebsiella pneumoniae]
MSDKTSGGKIDDDATYGDAGDKSETIHVGAIHYDIEVSMAGRLHMEVRELIDVHAFELTDNGGFNYLFIWINDYGLKWSTKTGHRVRVFPVSVF